MTALCQLEWCGKDAKNAIHSDIDTEYYHAFVAASHAAEEGKMHKRQDGLECDYFAALVCNKCGWVNDAPARVPEATEKAEEGKKWHYCNGPSGDPPCAVCKSIAWPPAPPPQAQEKPWEKCDHPLMYRKGWSDTAIKGENTFCTVCGFFPLPYQDAPAPPPAPQGGEGQRWRMHKTGRSNKWRVCHEGSPDRCTFKEQVEVVPASLLAAAEEKYARLAAGVIQDDGTEKKNRAAFDALAEALRVERERAEKAVKRMAVAMDDQADTHAKLADSERRVKEAEAVVEALRRFVRWEIGAFGMSGGVYASPEWNRVLDALSGLAAPVERKGEE